jgi:hypothetical protein
MAKTIAVFAQCCPSTSQISATSTTEHPRPPSRVGISALRSRASRNAAVDSLGNRDSRSTLAAAGAQTARAT